MKTSETQILDKDGYILVPKTFEEKKIFFELVKVLENGWVIYKRNDRNFELVKPYRQVEFVICGNTIPKKWKYPSSEDWGTYGFTGKSIEHCEQIYEKRLLGTTSSV